MHNWVPLLTSFSGLAYSNSSVLLRNPSLLSLSGRDVGIVSPPHSLACRCVQDNPPQTLRLTGVLGLAVLLVGIYHMRPGAPPPAFHASTPGPPVPSPVAGGARGRVCLPPAHADVTWGVVLARLLRW